MDPVNHPIEGHRSDMLLDLSGLTREERVTVQAPISNARVFDTVAEALIIQHPRFHLRENQRRAKGKGKDGFKRVDNPITRWFREKGKGKHTGSGKSGASAHHANLTSGEDYDYHFYEDLDESANANQAHNDAVDPGSDDGEETTTTMRKRYAFCVHALDDVTVYEAAELDATALLADSWNDDLDPELSAQLVQASAQAYLGGCKEFSHKGSNAHSIRLTCKICGSVRKEDRHPQRQDPSTCSHQHTDHRGATHTRERHIVLIVELTLICSA